MSVKSAEGGRDIPVRTVSNRRFEFGENWRHFLRVLDDDRIREAEMSMKRMLEEDDLSGREFLDIGSGSGLHSLVARRLGAKVRSFDYDPMAVACTNELRERYFPGDSGWTVEHGSVLNAEYLSGLGSFDLVYSWGVLHHTGSMWSALENALTAVKPGGKLVVAIYNDQGTKSIWWRKIKKGYVSLPKSLKSPYVVMCMLPVFLFHNILKLHRLLDVVKGYRKARGMSLWHDWIDWVGGYPFEVARPEEIFEFCRNRGFVLLKLRTMGGYWGCNEFVFRKPAAG
jgi:2-polyprenyl-3-methyl-5-hydroxy-6-metoxy-1,4-benzoquinol methylase